MSLVLLKCPNCAANLELSDSKEFAFCMHCGAKILIKEMVNSGTASDSRRLNNLIDLGMNSIKSGSSADLQRISMDILGLDSTNWIGWYLKGIAAAKAGQCSVMYDSWQKMLDSIPQEKYFEIRENLIHYAASAATGYGCDNPECGVSADFIYAVCDKEPEDEDRFAPAVIDKMCEMKHLITEDTALHALIGACDLAYSELCVYPDLSAYMGCYDSLSKFFSLISKTRGVFGDLIKSCQSIMAPYKMLAEALTNDAHPQEDFDKAIDYWANHDPDEYLRYFNDAEDFATELITAGSLSAMSLNKKMKKSIDMLIATYISHNRTIE